MLHPIVFDDRTESTKSSKCTGLTVISTGERMFPVYSKPSVMWLTHISRHFSRGRVIKCNDLIPSVNQVKKALLPRNIARPEHGRLQGVKDV